MKIRNSNEGTQYDSLAWQLHPHSAWRLWTTPKGPRRLRIVIISYYYPPDREVGGQRASKVAEALRAMGHTVEVIAAGPKRTPNQPGGVWRVSPLPSIRDLYARGRGWRWAGSARRDPEEKPVEPAKTDHRTEAAEVPRWKRWVFSLIWLPDDRQGFIFQAVRRALTLANDRPDLIYTTAPPFSTHLAGLTLKAFTGVPWVVEFRDPWTSNPWKPGFVRSAFSDSAERMLERLCLEQADMVVPVSSGIADRLEESGTTTHVVTIRNGIENLYVEGPLLDADCPFTIVYIGSFYHTRDPFPFLQAVERLVVDRALTPADLQVRFIGTPSQFRGRSITAYLRQQPALRSVVRLEGWMDRENCVTEVRKADALLLLAMDQPDQVPNKLYEYLGARRPILAVADDTGETADMLRTVGGHHVVPENDAEMIRVALSRLLDDGRQSCVGDLTRLLEWTTRAQMTDLAAAIGGLDVG